MQIDPNPSSSKELFKAIDYSKRAWLKVASTAETAEIVKNVESKICLTSLGEG